MLFILNKLVKSRRTASALVLAIGALLGACSGPETTSQIGVYSGRHYNTDKDLYARFTEATGIQVKLLEAKDDALIERLNTEGDDSPADVLILADVARLDRAAGMNLFQTVDSDALNQAVPRDLRDSEGRWFGLTRRLRAPMFNADRVNAEQVSSYGALADPSLKGKLCLRNRRSVYNQSLVAFMLDEQGQAATEDWIKGMVNNLAEPVFSSDTPMIRAVAQGQCGVALANSYYLGRMQAGDKGEADRTLSGKVTVRWPDPVHVNITGGGVATLSVASNYTGDTNVNLGGLNIASTLTSDVILANGSTVSGSGASTGSISGDGMVAPGNSPGILEFASLDASAGTDFSFEFTAADPDYSDATASVNDVLRLSDGTTPFTTALTSSSTVNIYLNVDSYTFGDEFRGGFFTDIQSDFITSIQDATFAYYLKDAAGSVIYNGVNYRNVTGAPGDWVLTTVPATANFAGGTVNGQVLQVVPEPSSFALLGFGVAGLAAAGYRRRKAAAAKAAAQIAA